MTEAPGPCLPEEASGSPAHASSRPEGSPATPSSALLSWRRLTCVPLLEERVEGLTGRMAGAAHTVQTGNQQGPYHLHPRAQFPLGPRPQPLEISQRQFGDVEKNMKSPLFPIHLLPRVLSHIQRGQQPWGCCQLRLVQAASSQHLQNQKQSLKGHSQGNSPELHHCL